jgi:hypothetical protein
MTLTVKPIKASVFSLGPLADQLALNKNPMPEELLTVLTVTLVYGVGPGGVVPEFEYVKSEKSKLPI